MSGPIPSELGHLTGLKSLNLFSNQLSGPIPPELGQLTNLELLHLDYNQLTGPIPPELGQLTALSTILGLSGNRLTGPIPPELGRLTNLERLQLHENGLSGPIPPELGQLANLIFLSLSINELSGPIPPRIGSVDHPRETAAPREPVKRTDSGRTRNLTGLTDLRIDSDTGLCPATRAAGYGVRATGRRRQQRSPLRRGDGTTAGGVVAVGVRARRARVGAETGWRGSWPRDGRPASAIRDPRYPSSVGGSSDSRPAIGGACAERRPGPRAVGFPRPGSTRRRGGVGEARRGHRRRRARGSLPLVVRHIKIFG